MAHIVELKEIPLKDLVVGKGQVRVRDVGKEIAELAESIRKVGLLEPIVVAPADKSGKYEIITGQRRYLASRELGLDEILAVVLNERVGEMEAKVLSLTENVMRRDLNPKDIIDVCTFLYRKYGTAQAVAEETGLKYGLVRQYVKYDRLIPELRDIVDKGEVEVRVALRAQDAASVSGTPNPKEAVKFAKEMSAMSGAMQRKLVKKREEQPTKPADEVIEDAKTGERIIEVLVTLGAEEHRALQSYAKEESITQDEAAAGLIADGLTDKGFLEA